MTGNSPQMPTIAEGEMEGEYPHDAEPITDRERVEGENEERGMTMFDQKHEELMNMQTELDHSDGNKLLHVILDSPRDVVLSVVLVHRVGDLNQFQIILLVTIIDLNELFYFALFYHYILTI